MSEDTVITLPTFRFLDLPQELRCLVYQAFFELRIPRHHCDEQCPSECLRNNDGTALQYVSRQTYLDTRHMFTDYHTFSMQLTQVNDFLATIRFGKRSPINHLTICFPECRGSEYDVAPMWWHKLDILSRLKTITFEETANKLPAIIPNGWSFPHIFHHFSLLPLLNNLLSQGGVKTSDWLKLNPAPGALPPIPQAILPQSYNFELSFVHKQHYEKRNACEGKWLSKGCSRCVIRQHSDPEYTETTKKFCVWRETAGLNIINPHAFGHAGLAAYENLRSLLPAQLPPTGSRGHIAFSFDQEIFLDEQLSHFLKKDAECGVSSVTMGVGFIGRWINNGS